MKLIHDLLPCGHCGVFYVKLIDINGQWLCVDCIRIALAALTEDTNEQEGEG